MPPIVFHESTVAATSSWPEKASSTPSIANGPRRTAAFPSTVGEQYRKMAREARAHAGAATLLNVRQLHLQSAERLDEIVLGLERVAQAKARDESAKQESAG